MNQSLPADDLAGLGFSPLRLAQLPGAPLRLVVSGGEERWHLAGRPVSAGAALELLAISARASCPVCWDAREDGRVPVAGGGLEPCPSCGDRCPGRAGHGCRCGLSVGPWLPTST